MPQVDENFGGVPPWKPSAGNLTNEQLAQRGGDDPGGAKVAASIRDVRAGGSARASVQDQINTRRQADSERGIYQAFADQGIAYQPDNPPPGGAY